MRKYNKAILATLFIMFQMCFILTFFKFNKTIDLNCSSTFTRNSYQDYGFFFKGSFIVLLKKNGDGELTIRAYTDDTIPKQVVRTYKFNYRIESQGQIYAHITSEIIGSTDNVDSIFYQKYFFDLAFDSAGQIRLHKFKGVYIFMSPDLVVSTCSPLE